MLIIDPEIRLRSLLRRILSLEGHTVFEAMNLSMASRIAAKEDIEVILCESRLPDGDGIQFVKEIRESIPCVECILLTSYATPPDALLAIRNSSFESINGENERERLVPLVNRSLEKVHLQKRVRQLEQQIDSSAGFENIIGESSVIKEAISLARRLSATDGNILLTGEGGTGKEVFAKAIHTASARGRNPFLSLNCGAVPASLVSAELFGQKAGTTGQGSGRDRKGLLEKANKGSLFLDEIGELDPELQTRLWQALEQNEYVRTGDTEPIPFNIRIFSTTSKDLLQEVAAGRFREDLYYRLNVFSIALPSLRERKMDIPLLAKRFLKYFALKASKRVDGMSKNFLYHLQRYHWKGNISELKNVIERAVIMSDNPVLSEEYLPFDIQYQSDSNPAGPAFDLKLVERHHLQRVLNYTQGNKVEAAKLLNIGLTTLYRKIESMNIGDYN